MANIRTLNVWWILQKSWLSSPAEIRNFRMWPNVYISREIRWLSPNWTSIRPNKSNLPTKLTILGLWIFGESCKRADWAPLQNDEILKSGQIHLKSLKLSNYSKLNLNMHRQIKSNHLVDNIGTLYFRWILQKSWLSSSAEIRNF